LQQTFQIMKIRYFISLFMVLSTVFAAMAQNEAYYTHSNSSSIRTLQVKAGNDPLARPFIALNGNEQITISFDAMTHQLIRYDYQLIHCNADWKKSNLAPIEYMDGFQGLPIEDYANSAATTVDYTNYRLTFPNENVQMKISGNYAVLIYDDDDPNKILATACFSVTEQAASISSSVTSKTDIDMNASHQQLSFTINHPGLDIPYPQNDLRIRVYQNYRSDNFVTELRPSGIFSRQIMYEHEQPLIFPGGNEFRRFEFLSSKYNGMNVEKISYFDPYYHADLITDRPRNNMTYSYDEDQNGRYFIRCSNCDNPDIQADYYVVHFFLAMPEIKGGNIYISGDLFNHVMNEDSRMNYNADKQRYEKDVLLKQGNYNYQYLFLPDGKNTAQTFPVEGDYFQTENEYTIYVYYHPFGARYDRLISIAMTRFSQKSL